MVLHWEIRGVVVLALVALLMGGCGGSLRTFEGDVRIESAEDLEEYLDYERVDGRVTIMAPGVVGISWPALQEISGDLWIWDNTALKGLNLSGLTRVESNVLVRNNLSLVGFDMSALVYVGGSFSFAYNALLAPCQIGNVLKNCEVVGEITVSEGNTGTSGCL